MHVPVFVFFVEMDGFRWFWNEFEVQNARNARKMRRLAKIWENRKVQKRRNFPPKWRKFPYPGPPPKKSHFLAFRNLEISHFPFTNLSF